jgi:DNA-directed RNA polymerase subunit RPC12/RpoP
MPYIVCPRCELRVYTAAAYLGVDACSRCGARLPHRRGGGRDGLHLRNASEAIEELLRPRHRPSRSMDG